MTRVSTCSGDDGCPNHEAATTPEAMAELARRAAVAAALEEVAREIRSNPDFPVPTHPSFSHAIDADSWEAEVEMVRAAARAMGVEAVLLDEHHVQAVRQFGPLRVSVSAVSDEHMAGVYATDSYLGSVKP